MLQTQLQMVNTLLQVVEETAIQAIDLTHPDVQAAIDIYAEQSVAVQSRGWWYNKEVWQLVPDTENNKVYLPSGTLEIDGLSTDYVKRGRILYDKENHSYDFSDADSDDLELTCIMEWDITELPPAIYRYVLILCKLAMVTDRDQDQIKMQKLEREAGIAEALALKANLRYSDPNRQQVNNAVLMLQAQPNRYYPGGGNYID